MIDGNDNVVTRDYASPPCFVHELLPDCVSDQPQDRTARADVARWRKAERTRLIEARLTVPVDERKRRSHRIAAGLSAAIGDVSRHLIGVYWPFRGEPDLRSWMGDIIGNGGRTALPSSSGRHVRWNFAWAPGHPLERGVWNILVPSQGPAVLPSIVIGFRLCAKPYRHDLPPAA